MSSKRSVRKKACTGKIRYLSSSDAFVVLVRMPKDGKRMNVYKCKFCKGYHIGHAKIFNVDG